mgnify:CR=1 FL=1
MTINGPIYSRGASSGINTVKSYNRFGSKNSQSISADSMGKLYTEDEGGRQFKSVALTSGTTVVVSGVTGYSIEVDDYTFVASGSTSLTILSGSTTIAGPVSLGANSTLYGQEKPLKTASGEALSINLSGSYVGGHLKYRLV